MENVRIRLRSRFFDEDGSGEKNDLTCRGTFSFAEEAVCIEYEDKENGLARTFLRYDAKDNALTMRQSGLAETESRFSPDVTHTSLYCIPGVGEFELRVTTRRLAGDFTTHGGHLSLDYDAVIGGARRRAVLDIWVEEV